MARAKITGKLGEEIALHYLIKKGFQLLAVNWRWKHLEIDLIGIHDGKLVILEVKTRKNADFGDPASFVSGKQQRNLITAANRFLEIHALSLEVRFDIVAILHEEKSYSITHIQDAFQPGV